jgi:hypothetical protein
VFCINAACLQEFPAMIALKGSELEGSGEVTPNYEVDEAVAEVTNAVEKNNHRITCNLCISRVARLVVERQSRYLSQVFSLQLMNLLV